MSTCVDTDFWIALLKNDDRLAGVVCTTFQASAYIDDGLNTFDAFHAALAGDSILSSDQAFNTISIDRVPLEPTPENE